MLLINFKEQIISNFLIPSFKLKSGEIAIINFPGGMYFYPLMMEMVGIFTGKTSNDKVELTSPFKYAEHIKEPQFRRRLFPLTIASYLKKHANSESPFATKIYELPWLTPETKIGSISWHPRRQLAVYATLSWINKIIFDLAGVDPMGCENIYNTVKTVVNAGGAAILIDHYDDFKKDCKIFIKPLYVGAPI